jgi:glycerol-3-phosphate dehydrogenase
MNAAYMNREQCIKNIADHNRIWDIVVIGGATGLGIALESASKGYHTLLLEQSDFAKSTSSKSTKLVHGGVRYLASGDVKLVREASVERGVLCRNAPHLVQNRQFIVPVYNFIDKVKYWLGLKIYDWISGNMSLGHSFFANSQTVLERMPGINSTGLLGGIIYHDGQFDDSRLAINLAQTIFEKGGCALNYMQVLGLKKNQDTVCGVIARDTETGCEFSIAAKAVINATGVFVDDILAMDMSSGSRKIRFSQGVHLVLDRKFLPSEYSLMIPNTSDGRVLFAVPWHDKLVVGTTDTPVEKASLEPVAMEKEIEFILQSVGEYLVSKPQRADIKSVFAGLRPLAATNQHQKTKEISRSHRIEVSDSGLFTIIGGKWTTYRKMAEDMIANVENAKGWKRLPSVTATLPIHGADMHLDKTNPLYYYGSDLQKLEPLIKAQQEKWISRKLYIHEQQVAWAVTHEMARTLEDVLSRRTRALLLDVAESRRIARDVATVLASVLQKDEQWIEKQVADFNRLSLQYVVNEQPV